MSKKSSKQSSVHIDLTIEQAYAVSDALDRYSRLCIGQLETVEELLRDGTIPVQADSSAPRMQATAGQCEDFGELISRAKAVIGYPSNGSNGIGHRHVHVFGHRAYEIRKVLDKALAMHRDPNPKFRGVNYDGLGPRYTSDPAPVVEIRGKQS